MHGGSRYPAWNSWELREWARAQHQAQPALVRNGDVIPSEPWPRILAALTPRMPVLVLTGTTPDVGMTEEHRRIIGDCGAVLEVVPGASHFVRRDAPQAFAAITSDWLSRLPAHRRSVVIDTEP
ncbi:alpha/beta fold hydrolase [Ruania halotolerans]|uniref:alpha/beta fold hydrolase n=1 Tax=Ruania halotolerans TaxID=2897773 RepID=UPI001E3D5DAD|nr:alpha/beta hydrolase [Ruania halotolerans]UFU06251.1 alpha/beta hydrolase [Ruania halotolerans]